MFAAFRARCRETVVCGEQIELDSLIQGGEVFGFGPRATVRGGSVDLGPDASAFLVDGVRFTLPVPGRHNVENALASIAACNALGVTMSDMTVPLAASGVGRRFQPWARPRRRSGGRLRPQPAKLAAAIETAKRRAARAGRVSAARLRTDAILVARFRAHVQRATHRRASPLVARGLLRGRTRRRLLRRRHRERHRGMRCPSRVCSHARGPRRTYCRRGARRRPGGVGARATRR